MKRLFKFKYPKILILILAIIFSYILFKEPHIANFLLQLGKIRFIGLFIAGMLFAFGFTAPLAVGFFISYTPQNIYLATIIASLGVVASNLFIFSFIKLSFIDEFKKLERTSTIKKFAKFFGQFNGKSLGGKIRIYLAYVFIGIIIASPLPDEIGVVLLSGLTHIKKVTLAVITFILGAIGIFILLSI